MSDPTNKQSDGADKRDKQVTKAGPSEEVTSDPNLAIESTGIEDRLAELAKKYLLCNKKSVEQTLAKAEVIVQAEDEIGKKHLQNFYAAIGESPKGSTIKKLRKIGEKSQRFKPYMDRLPDNWTTLYYLAILPEDKYLSLATGGILTPTATWKELSAHCIEAKPKKPKKVRPRITLDLNDVPLGKRSRFVRQMTDICKEFSVPFDAQRATLDDFVPIIDEE